VSTVVVRLAPLLRSYTGGADTVSASGDTLGDVLDDMERRFPGVRFRVVDEQDRVRRHMRCFVGEVDVRSVTAPVQEGDEVFIVGALSGG